MTFTFTVQVAPAAMLPPLNATELAPAAGAKVGAPQPVVLAFGTAATTIAPGATGKVSLKATPAIALFTLGLAMVKVRVVVPPGRIGFGANSLSITGGTITVSVATAEPPGPLFSPVCVVEMKPLMLVLGPGTELVTLTATVQVPVAGMVPPLKARLVAPTIGAVALKPQVLLTKPAVDTVMPVGNASANVAPVSATEFVFVNVKVKVEVAPAAIGFGENALAIVGWAGTPQPLITTLSTSIGAFGEPLLRPRPMIRNTVLLDPAEPAALAGMVFQVLRWMVVLENTVENAPPSTLANT